MALQISYWRCNFTRTIRIMLDASNDRSVVATLKLKGGELTRADQRRAERLRDKLDAKEIR